MKVPENKAREEALIQMVSAFCKEKLNDEYENLCVKLVQKMGRKATCPFARGKLEIWAAAVVHTIGSMNFLYDKNNQPYLPLREIHDYFGTKTDTVSARVSQIRRLMKLSRYFDPTFSISDVKALNPMNNLVMVNDMLYPIEMLPGEFQQMVRDAREKGEDISFYTESKE